MLTATSNRLARGSTGQFSTLVCETWFRKGSESYISSPRFQMKKLTPNLLVTNSASGSIRGRSGKGMWQSPGLTCVTMLVECCAGVLLVILSRASVREYALSFSCSSLLRKFIYEWKGVDIEQLNMTEVERDALPKQLVSSQSPLRENFDPKPQLEDFTGLEDLQEGLKHLHIDEDSPDTKTEQNEELEEELFTRDLIEVTKSTVNFNKSPLFPGSIEEIDVSVSLKQNAALEDSGNSSFFLRIVATCHNSEFNDLDEYVYSVRSTERFEYYDEVHFKIKKNERAEFKVAVKIPPVKQSCSIEGTLSIRLENTVPVFLPIASKCEIPNVICLKLLEDTNGFSMIKIPAKKNTRLPPVPFKNISNMNCFFELETIAIDDITERAYNVTCQTSINSMANSPFFVMLQLSANSAYDGPMPKTDTIRKVLVLKVRNSSLFFSFPIEVFVYESGNSSSVS